MHESFARYVHPVFERGLDLRRRIQDGRAAAIEVEQEILEDLILRVQGDFSSSRTAEDPEDAGPILRPTPPRRAEDIRYALACWLDEVFILASSWDERWSESKMEARLFGTNERAWRFWERAEASESSPNSDALEVFYLCMALGFRGELAENQERLNAWVNRAKRRFTTPGPRPVVASVEPTCNVSPLLGRGRLRRALALAGGLAIVTIPVLTILFGG